MHRSIVFTVFAGVFLIIPAESRQLSGEDGLKGEPRVIATHPADLFRDLSSTSRAARKRALETLRPGAREDDVASPDLEPALLTGRVTGARNPIVVVGFAVTGARVACVLAPRGPGRWAIIGWFAAEWRMPPETMRSMVEFFPVAPQLSLLLIRDGGTVSIGYATGIRLFAIHNGRLRQVFREQETQTASWRPDPSPGWGLAEQAHFEPVGENELLVEKIKVATRYPARGEAVGDDRLYLPGARTECQLYRWSADKFTFVPDAQPETGACANRPARRPHQPFPYK